MKQIIDFIPLMVFFAVYKMTPKTVELAGHPYDIGGPFSATLFLMVASLIVYGGLFLKNKKLEKGHVVSLIAVCAFGSMTLFFHNESFLKWKAPIVNWVFAVAFLGSQFIGSKPLVQRIMEHAVTLPDRIWQKMNLSWVVFFTGLGAANLFVAFTFHEIWVDFKVFGSLILTFFFMAVQIIMISRYLKDDDSKEK